MAALSDARTTRPLVRSRHDRHRKHRIKYRAAAATAIGDVAADFRPGLRPVSLAGRDRRHAPPAAHARGRRLRARRRDRRRDRAERRALSRRDRRARASPSPSPAMRRKLARRLQRHARVARIVDAPAERLPLADASVDTVVSTLVLCTVDDPERALREIARVLRPDGQLLFIEHVRASSRFLAACQDYLLGPVAALRRRLPLQPRDRRADARLRLYCRSRRRRVARHAGDRPSARGRTGDAVTAPISKSRRA